MQLTENRFSGSKMHLIIAIDKREDEWDDENQMA